MTNPYSSVAVGGRRQEAPVGVPVVGEDRRLLVGLALHLGDVRVIGEAAQIGVVAEHTEPQGEPLELVARQVLVGERHDEVVEPGGPDLADRRIRHRAGQVDATDGGAARLAGGFDLDRHVRSVRGDCLARRTTGDQR